MKFRRVLILTALLAVLMTIPAFAQFRGGPSRLGAALGIPNGVVVFRPSPIDLKFGYDFTEGQEFVFLSGDLRLIDNRNLAGVLHASFGIGAYGKFYPGGRDDSESAAAFDWGARVPVALSVLLLDDFLEFFVEVAPGIDLYPRAQFSSQPIQVFAGMTVQLDF